MSVLRFTAVLAALVFPLAAFAQPMATDRARAVADSTAAAMLSDSVVGVMIAAYRDGAPLFTSAYGFADLPAQRPLRTHDVLAIGSITKQFTAAAVLALVDEGQIRLDESVARYVPVSGDRFAAITVRNLLNHTSGLGRYQASFPMRPPAAAEGMLEAVTAVEPEFAPGERFVYSNANYFVLGSIIERVTGTSYDSWLRSRFFEPLGMTSTRTCGDSIRAGDVVGYLVGTRRPIARPPISALLTAGAGALCSTAADLARWSHALNSGQVLSPAAYRELTTPPEVQGPREDYAMGTVIGKLGTHRELWHNGALMSGFHAMLAHYPDSSLTVVVLANSFPVRVEAAARAVARALLEDAGAATPARPASSEPQ